MTAVTAVAAVATMAVVVAVLGWGRCAVSNRSSGCFYFAGLHGDSSKVVSARAVRVGTELGPETRAIVLA